MSQSPIALLARGRLHYYKADPIAWSIFTFSPYPQLASLSSNSDQIFNSWLFYYSKGSISDPHNPTTSLAVLVFKHMLQETLLTTSVYVIRISLAILHPHTVLLAVRPQFLVGSLLSLSSYHKSARWAICTITFLISSCPTASSDYTPSPCTGCMTSCTPSYTAPSSHA